MNLRYFIIFVYRSLLFCNYILLIISVIIFLFYILQNIFEQNFDMENSRYSGKFNYNLTNTIQILFRHIY